MTFATSILLIHTPNFTLLKIIKNKGKNYREKKRRKKK